MRISLYSFYYPSVLIIIILPSVRILIFCSSSMSLSRYTTFSSQLAQSNNTESVKLDCETELRRRGVRVTAKEFYPSSIYLTSPVTDDIPAETIVPLNQLSPHSLSSTQVGPAAQPDTRDDDYVVLSNVAVPDNVASNENLLFAFLGQGDELLEESEEYWGVNEPEKMHTSGPYWGEEGPCIPMHYYSRQIGSKSVWTGVQSDNHSEINDDILPPSSAQSAVDLTYEDCEFTSSDSLDSEQIRWVEEQLVAGNPKNEGYFQ